MPTTTTHSPTFSDREWKLAYRVALRVLKSSDQAEDAAQDALLRAYRKRATYAGTARFDSWLYRIAYTTALSHLRKPEYRRRQLAANDQVIAELPSASEPADRLAAASELASCLAGCLEKLRPLDRVAFTERFVHGRSERELGELLGVSTNAAKQRAFRARRAVRSCVMAQGRGPSEGKGTW